MNTDAILWLGLNNAVFSLGLGLLAAFCAKKWHAPKVVHCLWLLVLLKLLTPPMFHFPMVQVPVEVNPPSKSQFQEISSYALAPVLIEPSESSGLSKAKETALSKATITSWFASSAAYFRPLGMVWLAGSISLLGWSLFRIFRFGRLLTKGSHSAPTHVLKIAEALAQRLELNRIPVIRITPARISPMVWWVGGRVQIMIPGPLLSELNETALQSVLAHEMAHVKRRDYLVRWLEWLCCVLFWWNPMVWWAQRNLRATEEICCDALVLSASISRPSSYAQALLSVMEILAKPVIRPPAMASEINSDGFLERRFKMIVQQKFTQKRATWTQIGVLLAALLILPMGLIVAADFKSVERRLGEGIAAGELNLEEAMAMMHALHALTHDDHHNEDHDDHHHDHGDDALLLEGFNEGEDMPFVDDDAHDGHGHPDDLDSEHQHHGSSDDADDTHHHYSDLVKRYQAEADDLRLDLHDKEAMHEETVKRLMQLQQEYNEARERLAAFQDRGDHLNEEVQQLKAMVEESAKSRKAAEAKLNQFHWEYSQVRPDDAASDARRQPFAQAELELEHLVKDRNISKEVAQDKMMHMQNEFTDLADLDASMEDHEHAMVEAERGLSQMIVESELTQRQVAERKAKMQAERARQQDLRMMRLQRQYEDTALKLNDMVVEGELSAEEAKEKLSRLRDEFSKNKRQHQSGAWLRKVDDKTGKVYEYQIHDGDLPKEEAVKSLRRYFYHRSENEDEHPDTSGTILRRSDDDIGEVFEYQIQGGDQSKEESVKSSRRYYYNRSENRRAEEENERPDFSGAILRRFDDKTGQVFEYQIQGGDLPKEKSVKSSRRYYYNRSEKHPDEPRNEHQEKEAAVSFDFDELIANGEPDSAAVESDLEIHTEGDPDLKP